MNKEKILITGGTGFIGNNLITKLLKSNYDIYVTSHSKFSNSNYHIYHINLLDINRIEIMIKEIKPDYIIHLAWDINNKTFWSDEINLSWTQSTIELFKQFYKYGGKRAIFMGSYGEYSWDKSGCMDELNSPTKPTNLYGLSKLSCSQLLNTEALNKNYSFVWCRLFSVFGMNNFRQTISLAINSLISNNKFICNYSETERDFIYIEDVVSSLILLLNSNINGIINIGNNKPIKMSNILTYIAEKLDKKELLTLSQNGTYTSIYANNDKLKSIGWLNKYDVYTSLNDVINYNTMMYYSSSSC